MMSTETFNRHMGPDRDIRETIQMEDQGMQGEDPNDDEITPALDLNHLKLIIKSTDMTENMILFIAEKTILAFETSRNKLFESKEISLKEDRNTLICKFLKTHMDNTYHATWHVICGENYGSFFTYLKSNFIVYTFEGKWITIFKSG